MTDFVNYVAAYRTSLVLPPFEKSIVDPVKIEVREGPIRFVVPVVHRSAAAGVQSPVLEQQELRLPEGSMYLVATARMEFKKSNRPGDARRFCEDALDRVLATLAIKYTPDLLSNLVYRGFVVSGAWVVGEGSFRLSPPFSMSGAELIPTIETVRANLKTDADLNARFGVMARFLCKAASFPLGEERFVLLWTTLEIYPMKDTANIAPLVQCLADLVGKSVEETKVSLRIGPLNGLRSRLVHDGRLDVSEADIGEVFGRLEAICRCATRKVAGLPYDNALEPFWNK